jgi:hypothetical protein
MGVPTSEVGYTSATTGRGDHEVHKGHVVALGKNGKKIIFEILNLSRPLTFLYEELIPELRIKDQ